MPNAPDSSGPVFGPRLTRTEPANPLGKRIRLRIELEGCRGLRQAQTSSESQDTDSRPSYYVSLIATGQHSENSCIESSKAQEGVKSLRGTVQWNEVLHLECFELSYINIAIYSSHHDHELITCLSIAELLVQSELPLWDWGSMHKIVGCKLYLSTSQVLPVDDADEKDLDTHIGSNIRAQDDRIYAGATAAHCAPPACTTMALHTIICRLSSLMQTVDLLKIGAFDFEIYRIQHSIYTVYEHSLGSESFHPRVDALITAMGETMNVLTSPVASTHMRQEERQDCISDIMNQLFWSGLIMVDLANEENSNISENSETELARLVWISLTPDPTVGARSTSAGSSWHAVSSTIAKDVLLFALGAIVQSSDAFPPLKSAASGLLFVATFADMASSNKKDIRDIYRRIDELAASLKRGAQNGDPLSTSHQDAIAALAQDIMKLNEDLQDIIKERKHRFKRYFSAKRHRAELQDVVAQLDHARANYTTAVATLNATTNAQVLAHVKAITLVLGVNPMPAPGTRRADAVTFPSGSTSFEEM